MSAKPAPPDFSNVQGGHDVVAAKETVKTPDFSNVSGGFDGDAAGTADTAKQPVATYTVRRGDSLSKIAHKTYGHSRHWRLIFDANRDQIDNPDLIQPGQILVLPPTPAT